MVMGHCPNAADFLAALNAAAPPGAESRSTSGASDTPSVHVAAVRLIASVSQRGSAPAVLPSASSLNVG